MDSFTKCYQLRLLAGDTIGLGSALRRKGMALLSCGDVKGACEALETWLSNLEGTGGDVESGGCTPAEEVIRLRTINPKP